MPDNIGPGKIFTDAMVASTNVRMFWPACFGLHVLACMFWPGLMPSCFAVAPQGKPCQSWHHAANRLD